MPAVLMFTSPTCGPCKTLKPLMVAEAEKRGFALDILSAGSPEDMPRFQSYGVRNVPTVVLIEDGTEKARFLGGKTAAGLAEQLEGWGL